MQFLLKLHSKTSMVFSFLSNLGRFNSALRLQIERGTPLNDVQQTATYARAGAGRAAAERAAVRVWRLSDRELEIVKGIGK